MWRIRFLTTVYYQQITTKLVCYKTKINDTKRVEYGVPLTNNNNNNNNKKAMYERKSEETTNEKVKQ